MRLGLSIIRISFRFAVFSGLQICIQIKVPTNKLMSSINKNNICRQEVGVCDTSCGITRGLKKHGHKAHMTLS